MSFQGWNKTTYKSPPRVFCTVVVTPRRRPVLSVSCRSPGRRSARGEEQTAGRAGETLPPGGPGRLPAAGAWRRAGAEHASASSTFAPNTAKRSEMASVFTTTPKNKGAMEMLSPMSAR